MRPTVRRLVRDRQGGALVEYMIVTGVVALLALGAFRAFGTDVSTTVRAQGANIAKFGF
jgi:Flp pilus assembly pilin Flp